MLSIGLLIQNTFWAAIAALGFAVLFNVPYRALIGCMACGALGYFVRTISTELFGSYIGISTLLAAISIGFLGLVFARYWKMPAMIFSISGAIPLVPGVFAYQTMLGIIQIANLQAETNPILIVSTSANAINTAFILSAIALGIITPKLILMRNKPIV